MSDERDFQDLRGRSEIVDSQLRVHNNIALLVSTHDVDYAGIARLLSTNAAQVTSWANQSKQPPKHIDEKLHRLVEIWKMAESVFPPETILGWLQTPHQKLQERSPSQVLSTKGGYEQVKDLIGSIKDSAYS